MKNETLRASLINMGKIADIRATTAAMLNCKPSDTEICKAIAKLMQAEGLVTATAKNAGRTYSATLRAASADTQVFDSDTAKAMMQAAGMELPTKVRKGNSATAIIK